jgi:drug/metabolite transporter (DMT)-like permease
MINPIAQIAAFLVTVYIVLNVFRMVNDRLKTQRLIFAAIGLLSIILLGVSYFGDFDLWAVVVAWLSHIIGFWWGRLYEQQESNRK